MIALAVWIGLTAGVWLGPWMAWHIELIVEPGEVFCSCGQLVATIG